MIYCKIYQRFIFRSSYYNIERFMCYLQL